MAFNTKSMLANNSLTFFYTLSAMQLLSLQRDNKMLLITKKYLLIIAICCLAIAAKAQTPAPPRTIGGFVCTKGTQVRVADVVVTNKKTQAKTVTDDIGLFKIQASIGDTLTFGKTDYTTAIQVIYSPSDLVIFLQKVIVLDQVNIKEQTKQQELNSVMGQYRSKGVYYDGKPSAMSTITSPLNGLYSIFGKDAKDARRFAEFSKREMEASQDHAKYNKVIVKKITNLPDEEIEKFMNAFTPSHEDLLKWGDYEVIAYIKRSLEDYKKNGVAPMEKLITPSTPAQHP
jgi:hypothetical protein